MSTEDIAAKAAPPKHYCLMADVAPTVRQELFDVPQKQPETDIHHHEQTDCVRPRMETPERVG
ncbi:hypothetical protein [Croceicoccus sp. YJ47]|uniref:hypothetical protein n=1 Tax=Croceicoccus sp. YJ47 TaxID=2798724 RepID=UPI001923A533|nr:hypothetical protein [Croceicoccus sp. YJ47]QQN74296.1 hypothetical protein JD971_00305 [Croceicoccus sp. YJ47]